MWWQTLFADTDRYLKEYADKFARSTAVEIEFLLTHLQKGTVLDIPSGHGRHAIPLANAGYRVHCVDYQQGFLDLIPEHENITKTCEDMREYQGTEIYDNVICMFTSFGYFYKEDDEYLLKSLTEACKKGGTIIIDVRNPHKHPPHEKETNACGTYELNNYFPEWYEKSIKNFCVYGNYKGSAFTETSPRMIIVGTV